VCPIAAQLNASTSTLAGIMGVSGDSDGIGSTAKFNQPHGIALNAAGTFAVVVSARGNNKQAKQVGMG
jgi:hypothetical protein